MHKLSALQIIFIVLVLVFGMDIALNELRITGLLVSPQGYSMTQSYNYRVLN